MQKYTVRMHAKAVKAGDKAIKRKVKLIWNSLELSKSMLKIQIIMFTNPKKIITQPILTKNIPKLLLF